MEELVIKKPILLLANIFSLISFVLMAISFIAFRNQNPYLIFCIISMAIITSMLWFKTDKNYGYIWVFNSIVCVAIQLQQNACHLR